DIRLFGAGGHQYDNTLLRVGDVAGGQAGAAAVQATPAAQVAGSIRKWGGENVYLRHDVLAVSKVIPAGAGNALSCCRDDMARQGRPAAFSGREFWHRC